MKKFHVNTSNIFSKDGNHVQALDTISGPIEVNTKERLYYFDNLRLLVIVFVVMHHLAMMCSGYGSWYFTQAVQLDMLATYWFTFYLTFQQGYFMSLLFLISGYFAAESYNRKGLNQFVKDRFKRLIIPLIISMAAITPLIEFIELGKELTSSNLIGLLYPGVMWFVLMLFVFSIAYGLVMHLTNQRFTSVLGGKQHELTMAKLIIIILILSISAFLISVIIPMGASFASYIILFIVGIIAYKNNMLAKISYQVGKRWLVSGIVLGFIGWLVLTIICAESGNITVFTGTLTWQNAVFSVWSSFIAVSLSIGLLVFFREKFNYKGKLVKTLADNSFAVYMFHPLIIIAITLLLSPIVFYPIVKWLLLCVICLPLCFAATHFGFRKIPLLKKFL